MCLTNMLFIRKIEVARTEYTMKRSIMTGFSYCKDSSDYEIACDNTGFVRVHQLLVCMDNDPHEVFAEDTVVHHETGWKGDTRASALAVLLNDEHARLHHNGKWVEQEGEPRLVFPDNN